MSSYDETEQSAGDRLLCRRKKLASIGLGLPSLKVARAYAYPDQLPELL
jgi:hypothetical protein